MASVFLGHGSNADSEPVENRTLVILSTGLSHRHNHLWRTHIDNRNASWRIVDCRESLPIVPETNIEGLVDGSNGTTLQTAGIVIGMPSFAEAVINIAKGIIDDGNINRLVVYDDFGWPKIKISCRVLEFVSFFCNDDIFDIMHVCIRRAPGGCRLSHARKSPQPVLQHEDRQDTVQHQGGVYVDCLHR